MLSIVIFGITQIANASLYVAWNPKFVFPNIFSAHTQFGKAGCQNQGLKDIPSHHKKNTVFLKRIIPDA